MYIFCLQHLKKKRPSLEFKTHGKRFKFSLSPMKVNEALPIFLAGMDEETAQSAIDCLQVRFFLPVSMCLLLMYHFMLSEV